MKIGILTFHRALNYGAVLQAYALSRHINKKSGCSCEIIDYICPKIEKDYKLAYFTLNYHHYKRMLRKYMNLYRNYKRKKAFKNFNKVYLPLSNIQYSPSNIQLSNSEYDSFITGSDQVWDLKCAGFDETYFLTFVDDSTKKNSYGASFKLMQIPENIREEYYRRLNGFANVSCREDTGAKMIENIINRKVDVVIDPVMLLGIDEWERIATQVEEKDYILVYTISDSDRVKQLARKVSAMTGKKIIVLGDKINGYGVNVKFKNGNGPQEFVSYIKNADCVITNSFHGTVFSVLFHKTIWIDNLNVQAGNARLNSLMSMLSIEDFSMKDLVEKDKLTTNDIWNEREWAHVDTMIEAKRKEADDFLERFIAKNKGGIV